MSGSNNAIGALGGWVRTRIAGVGFFTRFFGAMLARSGIALSRPRLVSQQIHFIGNYSLLIIAVSLALGLGVSQVPEILSHLPHAVKNVLESGVATGGICALVMNWFLPEKK